MRFWLTDAVREQIFPGSPDAAGLTQIMVPELHVDQRNRRDAGGNAATRTRQRRLPRLTDGARGRPRVVTPYSALSRASRSSMSLMSQTPLVLAMYCFPAQCHMLTAAARCRRLGRPCRQITSTTGADENVAASRLLARARCPRGRVVGTPAPPGRSLGGEAPAATQRDSQEERNRPFREELTKPLDRPRPTPRIAVCAALGTRSGRSLCSPACSGPDARAATVSARFGSIGGAQSRSWRSWWV